MDLMAAVALVNQQTFKQLMHEAALDYTDESSIDALKRQEPERYRKLVVAYWREHIGDFAEIVADEITAAAFLVAYEQGDCCYSGSIMRSAIEQYIADDLRLKFDIAQGDAQIERAEAQAAENYAR